MAAKEQEINGRWLTSEQIKKQYSPKTARAMIAYCEKFPESLVRQGLSSICLFVHLRDFLRPWRYDENLNEFYIIEEEKGSLKKAETTKEVETTDTVSRKQFVSQTRLPFTFEILHSCNSRLYGAGVGPVGSEVKSSNDPVKGLEDGEHVVVPDMLTRKPEVVGSKAGFDFLHPSIPHFLFLIFFI